jgi:hypothetical protein
VSKKDPDPVNSPAHYNVGKIEVIAAIDDWGLGFWRAPSTRATPLEDLKKARWYLDHEIQRRDGATKP